MRSSFAPPRGIRRLVPRVCHCERASLCLSVYAPLSGAGLRLAYG
jgi:hypothetical protein